MRILFIDDMREVTATDPASELVVARTIAEAADALLSGSWDEVYFDHDMGSDENGEPITTRALARWVVESQLTLSIGRILVHSSNPVGAAWLMGVLSELEGVTVERFAI